MLSAILFFLMTFVLCVVTMLVGIALIMVVLYFTAGALIRSFEDSERNKE